MDEIKKKIEEIVKKIQKDKKIQEKFQKNPTKTVEDLLGIDLPDKEINKIVDGVKAKLTIDTAKNIFDKAKKIIEK